MEFRKSETVGMIVTRNIEMAAIFNYYGINFYSKGNRTLEEVCIDENVPIVSLLDDLSQAEELNQHSPDFMHMPMSDLSIYILQRHHRFAERKVIFIKHTMANIMGECENDREVLLPIKNGFDDLSAHLTLRMNQEEFLIFPFIRKMESGKKISLCEHRMITNSFTSMKEECEQQIDQLKELTKATRKYFIHRGNENTYLVSYAAMVELEMDLKVHMHLENNILFPQAFDFAKRMSLDLN